MTMRVLEAQSFSIDGLKVVTRPVPSPRRGEILVRVRAASLNYRDLVILTDNYFPAQRVPYVPCSDACGVVAAVGEDVTRFKVGDRVAPTYTQGWYDGEPTLEQRTQRTLGGPLPGVLQEYLVVPAEDAVAVPAYLSDVEAATLPVAPLTAWSVLRDGDVKPGDVVLVQGTGGVALCGLQLAKLSGARVIVLSSSDEKLARVRALGADLGINYRTHPDWHVPAREYTGGRGVDVILETSGSTLAQSLAALTFGGFIGVVGFVAGYETTIPVRQLVGPITRVHGLTTGSRKRFEAMNRAFATHEVRPIIDSVFALDDAADAFRRMQSGQHFGKIVIAM